MRRVYEVIIALYPAEYKRAFAAEMTAVLEASALDSRRGGRLGQAREVLRQTGGLLKGLVSERLAKVAAGAEYAGTSCPPVRSADLPDEMAEVQLRLNELIRRMEFAIAHHDFPRARSYSRKEESTRAHFRELVQRYRRQNPLALPVRLRDADTLL